MASKVSGYIGKINPNNGTTQYSLGSTAYGYCETAAATAAKTVDMTGFTLIEGATIFIKFKNANTSTDDLTLNVNSTGAKSLIPKTWQSGAILSLTFDGTSWVEATTYSLNATINSGTASQIAYYSTDNTISGVGDTTSPIYGLRYYHTNSSAATPAALSRLHVYGVTYGNTAGNMISGTAGLFSYGDGGPQITFSYSADGGQAGALIYTDNDSAATGASWHFVNTESDWNVTSKRFHARTGISIGTDLPSRDYNLYVNGTSRFSLGSSDGTSDKRFIIGSSGRRYLSIGASGIQAYNASDATSALFLNYNGGNVYIGHSDEETPGVGVLTIQAAASNNTAAGLTVNNGILKITDFNNTLSLGSRNADYCHIESSADIPFYFNKTIWVNGDLNPYETTDQKNLGSSSRRWANIYSAYTHSSTFYFGEPSFGGQSRAMLVYSPTYPNHGIWFFDETNDTMTLDVHGKANSKTEADLAIGALGAGIISTRNRYIPHTNNTTGTVGTQYIPVYVNAGTITQITANSVLTNLGSTTAASTYAASPRPGVTGTLPIENGGTGATTRLAAAKNLTNENVTSPGYVVSLTQSWANFGYTSIANLKTTLGLGANTTAASSATKQWAAHYTNATTISPTSTFYFTSTPSLVADREGSGQGFTVATNGTQIGRFYSGTRGTTSTNGITYLIVGNNVANGTAENAEGVIQLHGSNTGRHRIQAAPNANTSNYTHYLPHKTGWIASGGTATAGSEAGVGSARQPVYLSSTGILTACSMPQMQIVTRTGTGTNSWSVSFDFAPDFISVLGYRGLDDASSYVSSGECIMASITTSWTYVRVFTAGCIANGLIWEDLPGNLSPIQVKKSSDGKTYYTQINSTAVSNLPSDLQGRYGTGLLGGPYHIYNNSDTTYHLLAIKIT